MILQDFTGVPAIVDLAALRDAAGELGIDPSRINPRVPADLVIDHSVQVDACGSPEALERNVAALEGARHGFAFSSGVGATDAILKLFSAGDHLVVGHDDDPLGI